MGTSMSGENGMGAQPETGQSEIAPLTVAHRAWSERATERSDKRRGTARHARREQEPTWPRAVLVFDSETTIDELQNLTFGAYRYCRWGDDGRLACVEEGLFHADDLPDTDPEGYAALADYARTHGAGVAGGVDPTLHLYSRRDFLNAVFYPAAFENRALVVGFNLPFDLSRLAVGWGKARGGGYDGGFTLTLWEYRDEVTGAWKENPYRPRVRVKSIDNKRALIGFGGVLVTDDEERDTFRGRFLDLRMLAFALTNKGYTLAGACEDFRARVRKAPADGHGVINPEYIAYARQDAEATGALLERLRDEFDRHPAVGRDGAPLKPDKTLSPASLAKGYLRAMGVTPPLARWPDFPRERLGQAMAAFYGGRAECRIRKVPVPVVYTDFLSMYPTVNALMGTWRVLTAERCDVVEATDDVRAMLARVTPDAVLEPAFWRGLVGFAEVLPAGDVMPVRAAYDREGGDLGIGVNPYQDTAPRWYALPDLVASTLLIGKPPRVLRAWRLAPSGVLAGLRPVKLGGVVPVDPVAGDFFQAVIEERRRVQRRDDLPPAERTRLDAFLKVLANSGAYGIYGQFDRTETREDRPGKGRAKKPRRTIIHSGNERFEKSAGQTEDAGEYCFPPVAALITAAARLMLALLERLVTDGGGSYAFCDTDSMAIVASRHGGLVPCPGGPHRLPDGREAVRALSWADVDTIVDRFAALNPYDRDAVPGSVLKVEDVNYETVSGPDGEEQRGARRELWAHSISAKRYALYTLGADGVPALRLVRDGDDDGGDERAPTLVDSKEHGLGHLLNPTDPDAEDKRWMRALWALLVRDGHGLAAPEPAWLDRPAVTRVTASSPRLLEPLTRGGKGRPYRDSLKPFNFILAAQVLHGMFGVPAGADPQRFRLIRPYERDARTWERQPWTNIHDGQRYRVTARDGESRPPEMARVQTYRDVLTAYRHHPERKSADPDGTPCGKKSVGLLGRRVVRAGLARIVGKEANRLDDVAAQLAGGITDVLAWDDGTEGAWRDTVLPLLRTMPVDMLATAAGLSPRRLRDALAGRSLPHSQARVALMAVAGAEARRRLTVAGWSMPPRVGLIGEAYDLRCSVAACGLVLPPTCEGCGAPFHPRHTRQRYCSPRCRKVGQRRRTGAA